LAVPRRISPRWLTAAYALLLAALAARSSLRLVGDGDEYLDMASHIASFHLSVKYAHFWFYSMLAAPFVWSARVLAVPPLAAFLAVNLLLLVAAFSIAAKRLAWPFSVLLFVSPILWWSDKAHTEVFTFSMLATGCVLLEEKPWWSLVCLGAAAAQNLPIVVLVPVAVAAAVLNGFRDRRVVAGLLAALTLAALNPVYYYLRINAPLALSHAITGRLPTWQEADAVIVDLNLGLVWAFPGLALVMILAVITTTIAAPRWWRRSTLWFSVLASAVLLAIVSQAGNLNHGGTPGPSRYALWFVPLAIPWLQHAAMARLSAHAAVVAITALSAVCSVVLFAPSHPENHLWPSRLALWTWRHYPWIDNPVPESFIERLRHSDNEWFLPVTTAGCEKILIAGRGPEASIWPMPCPPVAVPPACLASHQLCYANRQGDGYRFVVMPTPPEYVLKLARDEVWTSAEASVLGTLLTRLRWWELAFADRTTAVVRATDAVGRTYEYAAPDRLLVYFRDIAPGASVVLRPPAHMRGAFIDVESGISIAPAVFEGDSGSRWRVGVPLGHRAVALVLEADKNGGVHR
jgi:hypothetical protein